MLFIFKYHNLQWNVKRKADHSEKFSTAWGLSTAYFCHGKEEAYTFLTKLTIGKNCSIFSNLSHLHLIEISSLPRWMGSYGKEDFLSH
jgi:hypothetical protein